MLWVVEANDFQPILCSYKNIKYPMPTSYKYMPIIIIISCNKQPWKKVQQKCKTKK